MSANQLSQAKSPYLRAHQDNPVHWRLWNQAVFDEARETGKPVLLSIGYTACHWCHVMNRESFEDAETAALINEHFIAIKVDREERPDIDQLYQAAANAMGHGGGWPLTMFLDPSGAPYFCAGYLPKEERFGQPSFRRVVEDVARAYAEQPQNVANNVQQVRDALTQLWASDRRGPINNVMLDAAAVKAGQRFDIFYGGLTGEPKFPAPHLVELMWRAFLRTGVDQFSQITLTTLHNVCLGGIWDHLGGGFYRYSTDERWIVPHFEKMLYDNAQMIDILTTVAQHNRWPLFIDRVAETINFLLRDMRVGDAFAAAIDADSEGEEGKYYLWSEEEIDTILKGTFSQRFKEVYNVSADGVFHGRNVLHRLGPVAGYPIGEADETLFAKQRKMLFEARLQRSAPLRDEQVLADWNGLTIAALARAGAIFKQNEWLAAASAAFDFVCHTMSDGDHLFHAWSDGTHSNDSFADDYAHMIRAALALFDATQDSKYLEHAQTWTQVLNTQFWDEIHGGYLTTANDGDPLFVRPRTVFDTVIPSANGVMIGELTKLFLITGDTLYRDRLNAILAAFAGDLQRAALSMPTYLNSFETALLSLQIIIIGPAQNSRTKALIEAVRARSLPPHVLRVVPPDQVFPESHAAYGKTMVNGEPTAYICQNNVCNPPVTDPAALAQALILPAKLAAAARAQAQTLAQQQQAQYQQAQRQIHKPRPN